VELDQQLVGDVRYSSFCQNDEECAEEVLQVLCRGIFKVSGLVVEVQQTESVIVELYLEAHAREGG
jgi:hypothetical protein